MPEIVVVLIEAAGTDEIALIIYVFKLTIWVAPSFAAKIEGLLPIVYKF